MGDAGSATMSGVPYPQQVLDIAAAVRNWGRWGPDDERGTLNFVTDGVVRAALLSVRSGRRFSLAYPLSANGLQIGAMPGRINPVRAMVSLNHATFGDPETFHTSDDLVTMGLQAGTHWDGLCHGAWRGVVYGGRPMSTVTAEAGATVCGIEKVGHLTSRGVLLDVARLHRVDVLEPGYAVTADDLSAAESSAGVTVRSGDIVLVRTGMITKPKAGDVRGYYGTVLEGQQLPGIPGIGLSCVRWFHDREVAAVATDNVTFEVFPWDPLAPGAFLPIHCLDLVEMGMTQGQNWDLEELAADCAADGQYDFLLEASPLPFVGGVGSPVNPVAIK